MDSPYARIAANLRENGYHAMPVMPGSKVPGEIFQGQWRGMSGWAKFCDTMPADFIHDQWEKLPDAGVCVAHGKIVGLDLDTDRADVAEAIRGAIEIPNVRRKGQKGWMAYYRPGDGLSDLPARVRWYDGDTVCVEILLHGTQSVLPPTIHPDTNKPYTWLMGETLENTDISELPVLSGVELAKIGKALEKIGLSRKAPRRVGGNVIPFSVASDHDLEKPMGRSLNDRAMEPGAIDQWWPALGMPKSSQRGPGAWVAVPFWRMSGSGRSVQDRNPNLKIVPTGIVDFGADRSYTPIDVVMAARDCSFGAAAEWLEQYIRAEVAPDTSGLLSAPMPPRQTTPGARAATAPMVRDDPDEDEDREDSDHGQSFDPTRWAATPAFAGARSFSGIRPVALPSDAEWEAMVPKEVPPFPLPSYDVCEGLLGDVAQHIDRASATATEAGALAVALPLLGAAMGRAYATPTDLRTNIYAVALGGSGTGKTSLVTPAKELMILGGIDDAIGQDRIASGSGLLQMLASGQRRICFLDEFGHMLQQIGSPGSGAHAKQIITEFTALYSAANTRFMGTAYATRETAEIDCPNLCLFGMATPEQFWRAFGSSSLEDGSIARYLVFPLGQTAPKDIDKSAAQDVADAIKGLQAAIHGRVTGNMGNARVCVAPMNEVAQKAAQALKQKETAFAEYAEVNAIRGGPAILRRVTENALKIALISAVGRNVDRPEIDGRDMDIGHALAWWSANVMISNIASYIADNQIERDVNEVERKIKAAGPDGIMKGRLKDRCRTITKRAFDEIIDGLCDAGIVAQVKVETKTRIGWKLVYVGDGE